MAHEDAAVRFVRDALASGRARADIEAVLLRAGWAREQAREALAAFADVDYPVPVPRPRLSLSARDAFLYLTLFLTLYISAWHLGALSFDLIDHAFPDPAERGLTSAWTLAAIRWSVASLMVAFPIFLFMSRLLNREVLDDPARRASPVRRWLTYLTLFLGASVIICDGTVLVDRLLGGELTIRFVLKAATAAIIAGSIFLYYLRELRADQPAADQLAADQPASAERRS
jgi:hypothetical protein